MHAAWYEKNGAARDVLQTGELPDPVPAPGEVRVRLVTSGVNPSDVKSRQARPLTVPRIVPHSDGAGIIDAVGAGVPQGRIGARVWVWNGQWKRALGTAATMIALPSQQAVTLPDNTGFDAGACLGIPVLTAFHALQLLEQQIGSLAGKTILVIGASSAVGHYVTQIATRDLGATVIGTVGSVAKAEHARRAGAASTIDYKSADVAAEVLRLTEGRGVAAIVDMDLSSTIALVPTGALADHGVILCYGSNVSDKVALPFRDMLFRSLALKFFVAYELTAQERTVACAGINRLLQAGMLDHAIGQRFPLDQVVAAHEAVEGASGKIGNVILDVG
ncbi:MAG: NADPH:quinone reductase [Herminiimonas sp.]|nr:NADPH:quinone reductase [Herminiimonas sp.]